MLWYTPYQKSLPANQTCLLELWDELGVPHDGLKQVYRSTLTIIGLEVDPIAMTITIPLQAHPDLIDTVHMFASPGWWHSLHDFQRLAGLINWALNTYPLLHPGLSCLYTKMSGKSKPHQFIWISISLCQELVGSLTESKPLTVFTLCNLASGTLSMLTSPFSVMHALAVWLSGLTASALGFSTLFQLNPTYTVGWQVMTSHNPVPKQPIKEAWTHEQLKHKKALTLSSAIEGSSTASYSTALQSYLSFCHLHWFPINLTPDTLSFYVVWMCHYISPKIHWFLPFGYFQSTGTFPPLCPPTLQAPTCHLYPSQLQEAAHSANHS